MDQRTDDWYEWRNAGLGSSDAPVILGVSPYSTPFKLWEEKCGLREREAENWGQRRGNELEPVARADAEMILDLDLPPKLFEHAQFSFLRASVDGWNPADGGTVLEIKAPCKEDHAMAIAGVVPPKYFVQNQHQLLVSGARRVVYYSYHPKFDPVRAWVEVFPDRDFMLELFERLCAFWNLVQSRTPPPKVDKDYYCIRSRELQNLLGEWETAANRAEYLKREILAFPKAEGRQRFRCNKYRIERDPVAIMIKEVSDDES